MNREIKFRVWDKKQKCYRPCFLLNIWVVDPDCTLNTAFLRESFIYQQFTGLKDKIGREIYEGDFLKDDAGYIYQVYWLDTNASFEIVCDKEEKIPIEYNTPTFHWRSMRKLQVIGNIFENQNSLKS